MNQFYVSIIFIGITLIVISLIWIICDRKKSYDYAKKLDEKKEELVNIIADAEQMIEELNKFSDYIVTRMELKNEELCKNLNLIDERLKQIDRMTHNDHEAKELSGEKIIYANSGDISDKHDESKFNCSSDLIIEKLNLYKDAEHSQDGTRAKIKEKVVPLSSRHKEVLQLADKGLSETEIAKKLSMGKGEIQLILGLNK